MNYQKNAMASVKLYAASKNKPEYSSLQVYKGTYPPLYTTKVKLLKWIVYTDTVYRDNEKKPGFWGDCIIFKKEKNIDQLKHITLHYS